MRKKLIVAALIVLVVAGLLFTGKWYLGSRSKSYSRQQVGYLLDGDYDAIYNNLADSTKEKYKDSNDFFNKFAGSVFVQPIAETRLSGKKDGLSDSTYSYQLAREDDKTKGYVVVIRASGILSKKTIDITVQEGKFLKN